MYEVQLCTKGHGVIDFRTTNELQQAIEIIQEWRQYLRDETSSADVIFLIDCKNKLSFELFSK